MDSETVERPDVGFAANQSLRSLPTEQKKVFFEDCCRFYANIVQKILKEVPFELQVCQTRQLLVSILVEFFISTLRIKDATPVRRTRLCEALVG